MSRHEKALTFLKNALDLGYNAFQYIKRDPDLENIRTLKKKEFYILLAKYNTLIMTPALIIKEGYCEIDYGFVIYRIIFNKNNTFIVKERLAARYSMIKHTVKDKNGKWNITNGLLKLSSKHHDFNNYIYIKFGSHTCTF